MPGIPASATPGHRRGSSPREVHLKRRYFYARVTRRLTGWRYLDPTAAADARRPPETAEIVAGVEVRDGEVAEDVYYMTGQLLSTILPDELALGDADLAARVERLLVGWWPDGRSYFIEVGRGALDEYVQVYQE